MEVGSCSLYVDVNGRGQHSLSTGAYDEHIGVFSEYVQVSDEVLVLYAHRVEVGIAFGAGELELLDDVGHLLVAVCVGWSVRRTAHTTRGSVGRGVGSRRVEGRRVVRGRSSG